MRWKIVENKKKIASENFEGHGDDIEMSGELVSGIIVYGVKNGEPYYKRQFAFPNIRIQPNNTQGTYRTECNETPVAFAERDRFERAFCLFVRGRFADCSQVFSVYDFACFL